MNTQAMICSLTIQPKVPGAQESMHAQRIDPERDLRFPFEVEKCELHFSVRIDAEDRARPHEPSAYRSHWKEFPVRRS